jgi:hypothetical protein
MAAAQAGNEDLQGGGHVKDEDKAGAAFFNAAAFEGEE